MSGLDIAVLVRHAEARRAYVLAKGDPDLRSAHGIHVRVANRELRTARVALKAAECELDSMLLGDGEAAK